MMGAHHAACGVAAWVAATTQIEVGLGALTAVVPVLPDSVTLGFRLLEVSPVGVVTGALVTAGAALLPDADHHNATIAHSLPPVSNLLCAGIGAVSGGHRKGTHSLLGVVVFVVVAFVAGLWTVETEQFATIYPGAGLLTVLLVSFAAKALRIIPDRLRKSPWVVGLTAGAFVTAFAPEEQFWFPMAMGIGVVVHILGDLLTTGGCNPVYPLQLRRPRSLSRFPVLAQVWRPSGNIALPVLGNAGSAREWCLLVPISLYAVTGVVLAISKIHDGGTSLTRLSGFG